MYIIIIINREQRCIKATNNNNIQKREGGVPRAEKERERERKGQVEREGGGRGEKDGRREKESEVV